MKTVMRIVEAPAYWALGVFLDPMGLAVIAALSAYIYFTR